MTGIRDAIDHAAGLLADGHAPHVAAAKTYLKHGRRKVGTGDRVAKAARVLRASEDLLLAKQAARDARKAVKEADRAVAKAETALRKAKAKR